MVYGLTVSILAKEITMGYAKQFNIECPSIVILKLALSSLVRVLFHIRDFLIQPEVPSVASLAYK